MKKREWRSLAGIIVLLIGVALVFGCGGGSSKKHMNYVDSISWSAEYDVVVIGFGGAGASASIAAAEAGAKVLLTEKAFQGLEGGNTRVSYQLIRNYTDEAKGKAYVAKEAEGYDHITPDIVEFIVKGSMGNIPWLKELGLFNSNAVFSYGVPAMDAAYGAGPDNPGLAMKLVLGEYPEFPGADAVIMNRVYNPDITDSDRGYWEMIRRGVTNRKDKITVWFNSPATRLIQDPSNKTIVGVQINRDGAMVNVRAKNGVVLACGGFENNPDMIEFFTHREELYPIGTLNNTGDGIKMAMEVGADFWHMAALSGPFLSIKTGNMEHAKFHEMKQNLALNWGSIYVGPDGMRFTREFSAARHGDIYFNGSFVAQQTPAKMWMIFDSNTIAGGFQMLPPGFDANLAAQIADGTVISANTIAELADKIGVWKTEAPANVTPAGAGYAQNNRRVGLVNQIADWNRYCDNQVDPQFNRPAANEYVTVAPHAAGTTLVKINTPPFYALELHPSIVNTQGGARRNLKCEILDPRGNPIPHLYGAGEFGSFYGGLYTAGGNLAESMFSGREAGKNAAAVKPTAPSVWNFPIDNNANLGNENGYVLFTPPANTATEFYGKSMSMGGELWVKVTTSGGKTGTIAKVEVVHNMDTREYFTYANAKFTPKFNGKDSETLPRVALDGVSQATISCTAIRNAVANALK